MNVIFTEREFAALQKRVIHPNNKRAKTLQRKTSGKRSEKEGF